jgi:hypothetical protein
MFYGVQQSTYMGAELCWWANVHSFYFYTIATSGVTSTAQNMNSLPTKCTLTMANSKCTIMLIWMKVEAFGRFGLLTTCNTISNHFNHIPILEDIT